MLIKKIFQGEIPENKILNAESTSQTDTYSCDYINNLSVNTLQIFSLEEQRIGTWIDGKPLYQKTIDFGFMESVNVFKHVPHNVANVDKIWVDRSSSYFVDPSMNYYDVSDYDWHTSVNATNVSGVVASDGYDRTTSRMYITIRYTKTTD